MYCQVINQYSIQKFSWVVCKVPFKVIKWILQFNQGLSKLIMHYSAKFPLSTARAIMTSTYLRHKFLTIIICLLLDPPTHPLTHFSLSYKIGKIC